MTRRGKHIRPGGRVERRQFGRWVNDHPHSYRILMEQVLADAEAAGEKINTSDDLAERCFVRWREQEQNG